MSEREVELTSEERDGLDYIVHRRPFRSDDARNIGLFTAVERIIAARLADAEARAEAAEAKVARVEALAEEWVANVANFGPFDELMIDDAIVQVREALRGDQ